MIELQTETPPIAGVTIRRELPDWTRYTAVDANGAVFAYADRPILDEDGGQWKPLHPGALFTQIGTAPNVAGAWQRTLSRWYPVPPIPAPAPRPRSSWVGWMTLACAAAVGVAVWLTSGAGA